ncbi:MAG TPA: outer membrane protein assembly factor BamB [Nevskiaceae bacterium]|nr:outer membrane protein assembly factor BamB [Nevskiaceae bacterium]
MRRGVRIAGVALVALIAACSSSKARKPAELKDIANSNLKLDTRWSHSPGAGDQGLFTGFRIDVEKDALYGADAKGQVYALNPSTGATLWKVETGARVISGPTVGTSQVLVGTLDGEVIALKRADGKQLWKAQVSSEVLAAPATDGERVIVKCVDGRLFALSAADGARLWTFDRSVPNLTLRGLSPPLITGLRVVVGLDNGHVVALKMADGQLLWDVAVAVPSGRTELERLTDVDASLIEGDDVIYALSFGGELAALDPATGQSAWRRGIKSYTGATLVDNLLFVTDNDGVIWALDAKTGGAAWKQDQLLYRRLSAPTAVMGYVVVGDLDGYVHWLDPHDGKIVARARVGSDPIASQPVAAEGVLYVANADGKIAAIAPETKK